MSWLSNLVKPANLRAVVSVGSKVVTGNLFAAGAEVAGNAMQEAKRVIARTGAPPEAQALMEANANNAITAAQAALVPAGAGPSLLNPLGAQGQQQVAIGGQTVSVNTIAMVGGGVLLLVILMMVMKR